MESCTLLWLVNGKMPRQKRSLLVQNPIMALKILSRLSSVNEENISLLFYSLSRKENLTTETETCTRIKIKINWSLKVARLDNSPPVDAQDITGVASLWPMHFLSKSPQVFKHFLLLINETDCKQLKRSVQKGKRKFGCDDADITSDNEYWCWRTQYARWVLVLEDTVCTLSFSVGGHNMHVAHLSFPQHRTWNISSYFYNYPACILNSLGILVRHSLFGFKTWKIPLSGLDEFSIREYSALFALFHSCSIAHCSQPGFFCLNTNHSR